MFITPALAQAAAPAGSGANALVQLLPFIAIIAIMYFLIIRPQQKRAKEHREMIAAIRRGDIVVTAGGIIGKVVKVGDSELQLDLGDGVKVRVVRATIAEVRSKTEPFRESRRPVEDNEDEEDGYEADLGVDEAPARPAKSAPGPKMAAVSTPSRNSARLAGKKAKAPSPRRPAARQQHEDGQAAQPSVKNGARETERPQPSDKPGDEAS